MTYKEAYSQCNTKEELEEMVKRDVQIAIFWCKDRLPSIEKAMNEVMQEKFADDDLYAKDIKDCDDCPLYGKTCKGGWTSSACGTPIEPPCTTWEDNTLVFETMYDNYFDD